MTKPNDRVNNPKHYTSHPSGVECIEITQHYNFTIGNAIKYLWRQGLKTEANLDQSQKQIEDLNKAVWYIQKEIQNLKEGVYDDKRKEQTKPEYATRSTSGFWNVRFSDWYDGATTMKLDKPNSINYNMNRGTQWSGVSVSGWEFYFGKGTNAAV